MGDGWAPERVGSGEVALARDTPRARQGGPGQKKLRTKGTRASGRSRKERGEEARSAGSWARRGRTKATEG